MTLPSPTYDIRITSASFSASIIPPDTERLRIPANRDGSEKLFHVCEYLLYEGFSEGIKEILYRAWRDKYHPAKDGVPRRKVNYPETFSLLYRHSIGNYGYIVKNDLLKITSHANSALSISPKHLKPYYAEIVQEYMAPAYQKILAFTRDPR